MHKHVTAASEVYSDQHEEAGEKLLADTGTFS